MHLPVVASTPVPPASPDGGQPGVPVRVMLLGVWVTAYAVINIGEHRRREAAGLGAVINPGLLDRLMDLPAGVPVPDPVVWAEMADQPGGVAERDEDGTRVTRHLESPLTITDVVVDATTGRELRAVQDASLFAGFTRRWIAAAPGRMPDTAVLEAQLCGVGIVDQRRRKGGSDHGGADVDGSQAEFAGRQALGELAGAAADFQDRGAGGEGGGCGDELRDVRRVAGARFLVAFGDAVEQHPLAMAFVPVPLGFSSDGHRPDTTVQEQNGQLADRADG